MVMFTPFGWAWHWWMAPGHMTQPPLISHTQTGTHRGLLMVEEIKHVLRWRSHTLSFRTHGTMLHAQIPTELFSVRKGPNINRINSMCGNFCPGLRSIIKGNSYIEQLWYKLPSNLSLNSPQKYPPNKSKTTRKLQSEQFSFPGPKPPKSSTPHVWNRSQRGMKISTPVQKGNKE